MPLALVPFFSLVNPDPRPTPPRLSLAVLLLLGYLLLLLKLCYYLAIVLLGDVLVLRQKKTAPEGGLVSRGNPLFVARLDPVLVVQSAPAGMAAIADGAPRTRRHQRAARRAAVTLLASLLVHDRATARFVATAGVVFTGHMFTFLTVGVTGPNTSTIAKQS